MHLYQLIHYWDRFAVPPSFREAIPTRAIPKAPRRMRAAFFAYFFLLLKKSKSPKASKATHDAFGPTVLEKRAPSVRVGAYQNLVSFNLRSN